MVCFLQMLFRFVFNLPLAWTEELSRYVFIILTYCGASTAVLDNAHVRVELIDNVLSARAVCAGTVFAVLIFISLLIACFKFIHKWETRQKAKAEPASAAPVPVKAAAPAPAADEDLMGDAELVAVISAAIAAYEGTSSNGLVVRSIRRVQRSKGR